MRKEKGSEHPIHPQGYETKMDCHRAEKYQTGGKAAGVTLQWTEYSLMYPKEETIYLLLKNDV